MRGAGGTEGGVGRFFIGFVMLCAGGYMFFNSIHVVNHWGVGRSIFSVGGFGITSGMVLVPFVFGIGMIFYSAKNLIGWLLTIGSLSMLVFGIIASINFRMERLTAFELIVILVLFIGGLGMFLSSLKDMDRAEKHAEDMREKHKL